MSHWNTIEVLAAKNPKQILLNYKILSRANFGRHYYVFSLLLQCIVEPLVVHKSSFLSFQKLYFLRTPD
jgi:hypothetical protein